jgi:hypothetical protein
VRLGIFGQGFDPPVQQAQPVERPRMILRKREEERERQPPPLPFQLPQRKRSRARLALAVCAVLHFRRQPIPRSLGELRFQRAALQEMISLRRLLILCRDHDMSQHSAWLDELSLCWHRCRKLLISAEASECRWIAEPLGHLLTRIASFGDESGTSLGSYLDREAGHDWYPIPFLLLLRSLHHQSAASPAQNPLRHWLRLLGDLIQVWKLQPVSLIQSPSGVRGVSPP